MSRPARYADIEALPAHLVGQIVDGELQVSPRPSGEHAVAAGALHFQVAGPMQYGPGAGWWILAERELHLVDDVLVPDLAGWKRERLELPTGPWETTTPDWVCEVLSPSTSAFDRIAKMRIYAVAGIPAVWLVDPIARTLEAFRNDGASWTRTGAWRDRERAKAEPFPEVEIDLGLLWPVAAP